MQVSIITTKIVSNNSAINIIELNFQHYMMSITKEKAFLTYIMSMYIICLVKRVRYEDSYIENKEAIAYSKFLSYFGDFVTLLFEP